MSIQHILVVEDNSAVRDMLTLVLGDSGYQVTAVDGLRSAFKALLVEEFDLALVDLRLGPDNGLSVLQRVREEHPSTEVLIMTGHGTVSTAVEAMRLGAFEYVTKPFETTELLMIVQRALEFGSMRRRVADLSRLERGAGDELGETIVQESGAMRRVIARALAVASSDAPVLIEGESGVGKEVVARLVHEHGRPGRPFVAVNCAAIPDALLESEMFGHTKGAFTDAVRERRGLIEEANTGSFFLDEVTELSAVMQGKLLRVLEDGLVRKVGSNEQRQVDVRFIAAGNRSLDQLVASGSFREDLFYRLAVIPIRVPPLRERPDDIIAFAVRFLREFGAKHPPHERRFHPDVVEILLGYQWPGNVRELRNVVQRAVVLAPDVEIGVEHCLLGRAGPRVPQSSLSSESPLSSETGEWKSSVEPTTLAEVERAHIEYVLRYCQGNRTRAAEILGISRNTLWRKLSDSGTKVSQCETL